MFCSLFFTVFSCFVCLIYDIHQFISSGFCFYLIFMKRTDYTSNKILILHNTSLCTRSAFSFIIYLFLFFYVIATNIRSFTVNCQQVSLFFVFFSCLCCIFVLFSVSHFVLHCFHDLKVFLI